jgi:Flp pilus assembly protein TadG
MLISETLSADLAAKKGFRSVASLPSLPPRQDRAAAIARARRLRPLVKRFLTSSSGSYAVEFGLIALPLFAMIVAMIELGVVFLAQNEIETATEKAARLLLTQQAQNANYTQSQFAAAVCGYLPALINCANLMIDVSTVNSFASANTSAPTLTYNGQGQVSNTWNYSPGGSPSILVLRVMYQFPVVGLGSFQLSNLANGSRLLIATAVFQVEPQ